MADAPAPLKVAASLIAVEALVFALLAVLEIASSSGERLALGLSTTAFFAIYAGALALGAWQLVRLNSWVRAPLVMAQLIQGLVGVSFWGGETTPVAIAAIAVAGLTLAGIFHPASLEALAEE